MDPTRIKLTILQGDGFLGDRIYRVVDDPRSYVVDARELPVSPAEFGRIVSCEVAAGRLISVEVIGPQCTPEAA